MGELRGNSRDPTTQRIVADIEDVLTAIHSKENLEPTARTSPSRGRNRRSRRKDDDFGIQSPLGTNLLRLSPEPELLLPESNTNPQTMEFTDLIQQFLSAYRAGAELSTSPKVIFLQDC